MAYERKTRDVYCIDTNYGYGWETESEYDTYDEAKRDFGEYKMLTAHYGGSCKLVKRRVRR